MAITVDLNAGSGFEFAEASYYEPNIKQLSMYIKDTHHFKQHQVDFLCLFLGRLHRNLARCSVCGAEAVKVHHYTFYESKLLCSSKECKEKAGKF